MSARRTSPALLAVVLVYLAGFTAAGFAADNGMVDSAAAGRVPVPAIPMGRGDACVEDTEFMRRNHMSLLTHQRDDTMLEGIRNKQHSLKECISCHAVMGADARPVTVSSPEHFCRSCHDYAAVSIDCFQCHASRPEAGNFPADHQISSRGPNAPAVSGTE